MWPSSTGFGSLGRPADHGTRSFVRMYPQRTPLPEVEAPQSVRVYLPIKSRERPFRLSSSGAE
jgi:hypothetical protein